MENMKENKKGRPPKRPAIESTQVTGAYVDYVVEYYLAAMEDCYNDDECGYDDFSDENTPTISTPKPSLRTIAKELGISNTKLKKLLITGGVYDFGSPGSEDMIRRILDYRRAGKTVPEICDFVGLKRSAVESCLPYEKIVYMGKDADWMDSEKRSLNAERCERYRKRKKERAKALETEREKAVEQIVDFDSLWAAIALFAGYSFQTAKGLEFRYTVKGGEIFFDRKDKSVTMATVKIAYEKAVEMNGEVSGPKKLGVFGASYLFPVLVRFGVIKKASTEPQKSKQSEPQLTNNLQTKMDI